MPKKQDDDLFDVRRIPRAEYTTNLTNKEKEMKFFLMGVFTGVIIFRIEKVEKDIIVGQIPKHTMESGKIIKKMDMEFGRAKKEIPMWGNGKMIKLMVMEFMCLQMGIDMKVNLKIV